MEYGMKDRASATKLIIMIGHSTGSTIFLLDPPGRSLVPVPHRVSGPGGILIGMARSAGVRNLVPVRHYGSYELESMRVNKGAGRAFGFN